jgi:hypothetical protein
MNRLNQTEPASVSILDYLKGFLFSLLQMFCPCPLEKNQIALIFEEQNIFLERETYQHRPIGIIPVMVDEYMQRDMDPIMGLSKLRAPCCLVVWGLRAFNALVYHIFARELSGW